MEMAAQLMQYGPLSVLILADGLQFYHSGVWTGVPQNFVLEDADCLFMGNVINPVVDIH